MRGALSVRINDGVADRFVTPNVTGLRFVKTANGGNLAASMLVTVPRSVFTNLGANDRIYIYDNASGSPVWDGYLDHPGATLGPGGEAYDLLAAGGAVLASDAVVPLAYVVQGSDGWTRTSQSTKNADTTTTERGEDVPCLEISAGEGRSVSTSWVGEFANRVMADCGLKLARVYCDTDSGVTQANYLTAIRTRTPGGTQTVGASAGASTAVGSLTATIGAGIPNGNSVAQIRVQRDNSSTTGAEAHWFRFFNIRLRQMLKALDGSDITTTSTYAGNTVTASQVITDMLGRGMIPGVDAAGANVQATAFGINHLAFTEGARFSEVMAALSVFEDLAWSVGCEGPRGHAFESHLWDDTQHRYELSARDGLITPGSENALCNRVVVAWTDPQGREKSITVSVDVPELGSRIKHAQPITLPPRMGSQTNATRAGQQALAIQNLDPASSTARIARPILDHHRGAMVMPWQIEPGYCALVRETGQRLRVTQVEYVDQEGAATLTLGRPVPTTEQLVARLTRANRRRTLA